VRRAEQDDLGYQQAIRYAEELRDLYAKERARTSELEAAQAHLRRAEAKYRSLVERIPAIVYEADFGAAGAWRYVSPKIESILGFGPEEWLADPELWFRQVHPDDRARVLEDEIASRDKGGPTLASEYRMLSRDGRVVWVRDEAAIVRGHGNQPPHFQGIMLDITERKQAEEEMRRSEARKSAILEAALDCVITIDHEGKVVEFNPAAERTFGYGREEVVGKEMAELLIPSSLRDAHREGIARYLSTGEGPLLGKRYELTGIRADGTEFPVEVAITRVDVPGSPLFTGYLRDITERKRAEEELRRADDQRQRLLSRLVNAQEEERSRIAGDIHDDSIQVMTAVGMRLEILSRALEGPEQRARLEQLEDTVRKAIGRLRNLLFELRPPALDREGLVPALRITLEQDQVEHGLAYSLENHLAAEPHTETRVILYRIAQEILTNVRKHANATNVDVLLEGRDGGFFLRISDDGVGFSLDEGALYRPGHLGLAAVRERAEMAGGSCRIESAPGVGTTVEVWLPGTVQDEEQKRGDEAS
jgi:PAS domain S-box-containing protein